MLDPFKMVNREWSTSVTGWKSKRYSLKSKEFSFKSKGTLFEIKYVFLAVISHFGSVTGNLGGCKWFFNFFPRTFTLGASF